MNPFTMPSGHFSGDTFPIFRDGVCHLFHMMMPVIAHHVSRDLLHWEQRPVVVMPGAPGEPDSQNIATGCVVEHAGRFYLFYTGNQNICLAISDDLDHWEKFSDNPVVQGDGVQYGTENFRDAYVFWYEPENCWWMLFGTQTLDAPEQRAGCVGMAKSTDLLHWSLCPPLWSPHIGPHCDCPQLISQLGHWYLFYLQRNTRYRVAEHATGPFLRPAVRNLGTTLMAAASRPAYDGRRWLTFPFVMRQVGASELGDWQYGGPLAIPRQLDFQADGTVTERPAEEILAAIHTEPDPGDALTGAHPLVGAWTLNASMASCTDNAGGTVLLPMLSPDCYVEFSVVLDSPDSDFHLLLRTDDTLMRGYQLAYHPQTGQLSLRSISQFDTDRVLASRSVVLPAGTPITMRVFLCGNILEVFIDDRASLTSRVYQHRTGQIGFEFRDGGGTVSDIRWRAFGE